ncbi:unnamed protein product, partial [marine sediment metagenome]
MSKKSAIEYCDIKLPNGVRMRISIPSINEIREIYFWKVYEASRAVKEGDIVIDVGAEVGTFSLKAAYQKAAKIIAIEPHPDNFEMLNRNIESNPLLCSIAEIQPIQIALANILGKVKLYDSEYPGSHSIAGAVDPNKFIMVDIDTLDNLLDHLKISKVNFIKMDVEGAAHYVLQGATETLKQDLHLAIAVYHGDRERIGVLKILDENGFEYKGYTTFGQQTDKNFKFIQAWKG